MEQRLVRKCRDGSTVWISQGDKKSKLTGLTNGDRKIWGQPPPGKSKWLITHEWMVTIVREWGKVEDFLYPRTDENGKKTGYRGRDKILSLLYKGVKKLGWPIDRVCASEQLDGFEECFGYFTIIKDNQQSFLERE